MDDETLRHIVHDPAVDVFSLQTEGKDRGILELDRREMPDIELAFIGVIPDLIGKGAGRFLLAHALDIAWSHKPKRVHVHTCTIDHPHALGFYQRAGFVPYKRAIEIADDPRLDGTLPLDGAPQCPLIATQ
jgi:GNAT superfamily N-acetyltransferase